jgi:hypothetical protein
MVVGEIYQVADGSASYFRTSAVPRPDLAKKRAIFQQ